MKRIVLLLVAVFGVFAPSVTWADSQFKLLVLAMPSKYHYEYVPIARESLEKMARLHEFEVSWAGAGRALEQDLSGYRAIVLLNTPVEDLTAVQREKFEAYVKAGGHVMVVHRAAIALPAQSWPWYEQVVGRTVGVHPMLQTGVVEVVDRGFPAVFGLSDRWVWSDEFYTTSNPYGVEIHPVLNVDERSYDPEKIWPGLVVKPMGKDHPIAWYHRVGGSRVFVTTLGHNGEAYRDPQYLAHLLGGIYWTATGLGQTE